MTLAMRDLLNREEGEDLMLTFIEKLIEEKRLDDIAKIRENKQYRQKLCREYHIID